MRRKLLVLAALLALVGGITRADIGFSSPPRDRFPLVFKRFDFTAAQVKLWGTTNPEILPAVPNYLYRFEYGILYKLDGDAFACTCTQVQVRYDTSTPSAAIALNIASVMDQTTEAAFGSAPGSLVIITPSDANRPGGKAIKLGTQNNADFTGTGSAVSLFLSYRLTPANSTALATLPVTP